MVDTALFDLIGGRQDSLTLKANLVAGVKAGNVRPRCGAAGFIDACGR